MERDEITFKSDDESDELIVEEIMNKIRNNVRKRYRFNTSTCSEGNSSGFDLQACSVSQTNGLKEDFECANSNSDILNKNYYISSHRPFIGKFLVNGRKLVHGEVKRYVDASLMKQNNFNVTILRLVEKLMGQFSGIETRFNDIEAKFNDVETRLNAIDSKFDDIEKRFNDVETKFKDVETRFQKIGNRVKELGEGAETTAWADLYSAEITEGDLVNNISYHDFFIELIKKYSELSAAGRPPRILEVGLGNGTMSIYFSRDCNYDVYGIDNDIHVLDHNMKINKNLGGYAKFMLVDAFDLNLFQKKFFDVSFSQGTLEHFDNSSIVQLIRKQLEVSKYVIFSVPSINWPTRELGNERKMSLEDWRKVLKSGGFNLLNLEYYKDDLHIVGVVTD